MQAELLRLPHYQIRHTIAQSKRLDDYNSEKLKKNSLKFSAYAIFKKLAKWSFQLGSKIRFRSKIEVSKIARKCFEDVYWFISTKKFHWSLAEKWGICLEKRLKRLFLKIAWAKIFWDFLGFFRGLLIMMRRLRYRLSYSVVWESQKFSIIRK